MIFEPKKRKLSAFGGWSGLTVLAFLLTMFSVQSFTLPTAPDTMECTCIAPANGAVTQQTDTTVSFDWDSVAGASSYDVWYVRNDGYTSPKSTVTQTSVSFSGLAPGNYVFYISTTCGLTKSGNIILEDVLMG